MASYIRLLAFTIVSSLAYPLAASAQNSSDLRSLTIPASACEIGYTEFSGDNAAGGKIGSGSTIYVQAPPGGTAVLQATCPVPLSNIRVSGSGSPRLAKFRVYYMDSDAAGTAARVHVDFIKVSITGSGASGCGVGCNTMDSNISGNTSRLTTASTATCSVPYTFQAKAFYVMVVTLFDNSQFYGIDFP